MINIKKLFNLIFILIVVNIFLLSNSTIWPYDYDSKGLLRAPLASNNIRNIYTVRDSGRDFEQVKLWMRWNNNRWERITPKVAKKIQAQPQALIYIKAGNFVYKVRVYKKGDIDMISVSQYSYTHLPKSRAAIGFSLHDIFSQQITPRFNNTFVFGRQESKLKQRASHIVVVLNDGAISREHFTIKVTPVETGYDIIVEDTVSNSGTFVYRKETPSFVTRIIAGVRSFL